MIEGLKLTAKMSAPNDHLVIPVRLEKNLALPDGSTEGGCPIAQALQLDQSQVANLYSTSDKELKLSFQEHGVAYNETGATDCLVEATIGLMGGENAGLSMTVDPTPIVMWGVNFAGKVIVKHKNGTKKEIYLPGTRTYDPAGLTGDPHASERIGPSCSRTQLGITITELVASLRGADLTQVVNMHEKIRHIVNRYHGREVLFDWMKLQVEEAVFSNTDMTPYPEYIKKLIREGKFELGENRQHTRAYLESYNKGQARPPVQYYLKVAKKDKVDEILSAEEKDTFSKIVGLD